MSVGKWFLTLLLSVAVTGGTLAAYWRVLNLEPARPNLSAPVVPTEPALSQGAAPAPNATATVAAPAAMDAAPAAVEPAPTATPASVAVAAPVAAPTQTAGVKVVISAVFKPGQRTLEYVLLVNEAGPVDMTGWTLEKSSDKVYTFPDFVLFGDTFVRIYTMNGTDAPTTLFLNKAESLWKPGDVVLLKNGDTEMARFTVK